MPNWVITHESRKTYPEQINSYNAILSARWTGIAERSNAMKQITMLFETADAPLDNMNLSIGIIKLTNPDFFDVYNTSRNLTITSSRRKHQNRGSPTLNG